MKISFDISSTLFLIALLTIPFMGKAQKTDTTMIVNGVCSMCQFTIESTSLKVPGVESASWDVDSKVLTLNFDSSMTSLSAISDSINASGYDTEYNTATDEAYYGLHKCCYYRDPKVVEDHKNE